MQELRTISDIASRLADLVGSSMFAENVPWDEEENVQIADWLYLGAGIQTVALERARLLVDFGFCRGADRFELDRDVGLTPCVTELSRFLFLWGGLETAIAAIDPPPDPLRRGKINAACRLIREAYGDSPVTGLDVPLKALEAQPMLWAPRMHSTAPFAHMSEYGKSAIGLHVVYALRNSLAHGSLRLPNPEEARDVERYIRTCGAVTLLSLQMLLSGALRGRSFEVSCSEFGDCDVEFVLNNLHLNGEDDGSRNDL